MENVEIDRDALSSFRGCELLGVFIRGFSDEEAAAMAEHHLVVPASSAAVAKLEARASALLRKCYQRSAQRRRRIEGTTAIVASLGRAEKQLLRWVLDVTAEHWRCRIEPIPSMDSVLANRLADLVPPERAKGGGKASRRDRLV